MGTDIKITKKLGVKEEGTLITGSAANLNFVGSGVNASAVGEEVTISVPGSIGSTVYYLNETVTVAGGFKEFNSVATTAAEQTISNTINNGATKLVASYLTPAGLPNTTVIPAGLWQLYLHFAAATTGQSWIIRPEVYVRDLSGVETLVFTPDPEVVNNMSTTTTMYTCDGVFPNTTLLTTDRIMVKIFMENISGSSKTVLFKTEGSQHYSVATTTLNQAVTAGTVTDVTGTAPVVSSGGTTPAISIPKATASVDGYLSATDWSTFNNGKVLFYTTFSLFPATGADGFMYVDNTANAAYLWDTSTASYIAIGTGPAIADDPTPLAFVNAATTNILSFNPTYYNGPANDGVGATLTAATFGKVTDGSTAGFIDFNYAAVVGDYILVKNQTAQQQNGLYEVIAEGSPTAVYVLQRVPEYDESVELYPLQVNVLFGQDNALKYFTQTTANPVIGNATTGKLIFQGSSLQAPPFQIGFVDTATTTALPTCVYTNGPSPSIPGQGALLTASVNGALPSIGGVTPSITTLSGANRILVKNQADSSKNGDYVVVSAGSATTKWVLRRINNTAAAFDRYTRIYMVSNVGSSLAGKIYLPSINNLRTNLTIGTPTTGNLSFTEYGGSSGLIYIINKTTGSITYYSTLELARDAATLGDTIYVNPGTYTVTTTVTNGLAKNGVNWYFEPGAVVNKATIGDIFNDTTFNVPMHVFGEGTFNKTGLTGTIFTSNTALDFNFEHYSSTNSTSHCFVFNTNAKNVVIKVFNSTSSAGCVILPSAYGRLVVNFQTLKSTSSNVIGTGLNQVKMFLNGNLIQSTTSVAISSIWNYSDVVANVTNTIGVTYGYSLSNNNPTNLTINGNTTGIQASAGNIYMNGYCGNLNSTGAISFLGGQIGTISGCTAGYIKTGWTNDGGMISISGGVVELDMPIATASDRMRFNLTGGKFVINGDYTENYYTRQKTINGGEFVINGDFICTATANNESYNAFFTILSGIFRINGRIRTSLTSNNEPLILWQGGKIIMEDAKLIIGQTNVPPIVATAAGLVLKVLGTMQTNFNDGVNNVFASRKQLYRFTINTAGVAAQLTINLGAVISETNVATYNTKALMAERIKNLINASYASTAVIATYTAGNDYFDLEALVASVSYVTGSESNLSIKKLILNSHLITDLTNGVITQNTNVE